jgi:hypothetical protein
VELTSFEAVADGSHVALTWATATESGNAGFAVEHRIGDQAFVEIGYVEGHGTTTEPISYRFDVVNLGSGLHHFRLRQIDLDGSFTYSEEVEVELLPYAVALVEAYPNPFNPTTTITYSLPQAAEATLSVFDLLGRQVRVLASGSQPAGTYEVTFDATELPSGVYFYRLEAGDYVETKSLVLLR